MLDLPGGIAMDAPALSFEDLTALASDRVAWRESFGKATHEGVLKTQPTAKVSVTINRPLLTTAENNAVRKAWAAIFKPQQPQQPGKATSSSGVRMTG